MQITSDYTNRFGGLSRLFGAEALPVFARSHVTVVGIGGVGSWAAEALARTGIGRLTLVDLDDLCITNTNRQIHALSTTFGHPKTTVMAERIRAIHPGCAVTPVPEFFQPGNAERLLDGGPDCLIDAVDHVAHKCLLLASCRSRGIPVVSAGAAGGKRRPAAVRVADLHCVTHDPLLRKVRRILRADYGFPPAETPAGIPCIYSEETPVYPWSDGTVCAAREPGSSLQLDCASGFGTAAFVTGAFGFACAAEAVRILLQHALPATPAAPAPPGLPM